MCLLSIYICILNEDRRVQITVSRIPCRYVCRNRRMKNERNYEKKRKQNRIYSADMLLCVMIYAKQLVLVSAACNQFGFHAII